MQYILRKPKSNGSFPAPQSIMSPGLVAFPDEFLPIFYPEDKQAAGFVTITHDGETVTDCQWNEAAYQAYLDSLPEPVEPPEEPNPPATLEDRLTAVEAETAALTAAIERGLAL